MRRSRISGFVALAAPIAALLLSSRSSAQTQAPPPTLVFIATMSAGAGYIAGGVGVAADGAGNSYALLGTNKPGFFLETVKFSSAGAVQWSVNVPSQNSPVGIAADPAGNVYFLADDGTLVKYDANGALVKSVSTMFASSQYGLTTVPTCMVYDPTTARLYIAGYDNNYGFRDTLVLAYDSDLILESAQIVDDPGFGDRVAAIAVDSAGFVYIGASQMGGPPDPDRWQVVKLPPNLAGPPIYNQSFVPEGSNYQLFAIAADPAGNVQVAGTTQLLNSYPGLLVKLDATGQVKSSFHLEDGANPINIVDDAEGNAYIVDDNYPLLQLIKFDPQGNVVWKVAPFNYGLQQVALDSQRNVYLTGTQLIGGVQQAVVAKYSQGGKYSISIDTSVSSDGQIGVVGSTLPVALSVVVRDASSATVANAPVVFTVSTAPANAIGQNPLTPSAVTSSTGAASTQFLLGTIPADYFVNATCGNCVPSASSATFHVCAKLGNLDASGVDLDYFNQAGAPWGPTTYDQHPGTTMQNLGCATSSLAMVARYLSVGTGADGNPVDPGHVNTWLDNNSGYDRNHDVKWQSINTYAAPAVVYDSTVYESTDNDGDYSQAQLTSLISQDLSNGLPVVAEVVNPTTGHSPHFIVLTGLCSIPNVTYTVSDPGNRASSNWSFTSNNTGQHLGYTLLGIRRFRR